METSRIGRTAAQLATPMPANDDPVVPADDTSTGTSRPADAAPLPDSIRQSDRKRLDELRALAAAGTKVVQLLQAVAAAHPDLAAGFARKHRADLDAITFDI